MYKIFSTFTGAGGLDIGFHGDFQFLGKNYPKLNFTTNKALEINAHACETLKNDNKYFKNTTVLNEDITKVNPNDFKHENYDVLLGGFPCVTFSIVGKQIGLQDDINGKLYENFVNFVEVLRPKVFLAENVKGILSANKGEAIKIITKRFEDTGYTLQVHLVNFADYGVPQLRQRVLFIGVRDDIKETFILPKHTHKNKHITSQEAFENLNKKCVNHNFIKQLPTTTAKLQAIPEGGNFKDLPPELAVKGRMSNIYRKLDRNKPAYTVLASGGGGTWTYHYEEPRALSNRERARLQAFPDDLIFKGSNTEVRRQIGNAVPAVGVYPFAREIERVLDFMINILKKFNGKIVFIKKIDKKLTLNYRKPIKFNWYGYPDLSNYSIINIKCLTLTGNYDKDTMKIKKIIKRKYSNRIKQNEYLWVYNLNSKSMDYVPKDLYLAINNIHKIAKFRILKTIK
ncbi:MAG: DNA-cytosine methyltransferase (EC [uncultured Sulfurovum sp.]|uniref:Cytosine-specific methyltransferase n=1 Tax=uncultured Sulfurovum sp. TaxID=269237 RepID=A0A6S6TQT9_9BACT|nr:MAG: DNA-cytosine methyltransferase (EC [uncultured Sulfurovum sp.]